MYFISATRLKLRSVFMLPAFMKANSASVRQLLITDGFVTGKELIDKGLVFWTLTLWAEDAEMRSFRNSVPHRQAMRRLPEWCNEATYTHWLQESPTLPEWPDVHQRIVKDGIISKVRLPTDKHQSKAFPAIKWTKTERIFKPGKK